jgi:hypothetical protein
MCVVHRELIAGTLIESDGGKVQRLLLLFARGTTSVRMPKTSMTIVAAFVALFPLATKAQSPRDYVNTPVDSGVLMVDFLNSNTETASGSDLPLPNNESVGRVGAATYLWSFPLFNRYAGVAVTEAYTSVSVKGPQGKINGSGFTDPGFTFHMNFFGAPALRRDQFADAIPTNYMSIHLTVNPPLGSYDRNSAVTTGANRWAFSPLVNLDLTPDKGVSWIDLYASARLYTDNNEFQGNNKLSQDSLVTLSGFYSHNIGTRMFWGIGVSYDYGGETYVDNVPQHNAASGFRPSFTFSRARTIWKYRLTLRYELTATTPRAAPTNSAFLIRLSGPLP